MTRSSGVQVRDSRQWSYVLFLVVQRDLDGTKTYQPKIIKTKGEKGEQLSRKRRLGFLSAIGRADLANRKNSDK